MAPSAAQGGPRKCPAIKKIRPKKHLPTGVRPASRPDFQRQPQTRRQAPPGKGTGPGHGRQPPPPCARPSTAWLTVGFWSTTRARAPLWPRRSSARSKNPLSALMDGYDATLPELLEVRLALESNAAMLAARRATSEDIANLEQCYLDMKNRVRASQHDIGDDVFFPHGHSLCRQEPGPDPPHENTCTTWCATASGNLWPGSGPGRARCRKILGQHCDVLQAIRNHDARRRLRGHARAHHIRHRSSHGKQGRRGPSRLGRVGQAESARPTAKMAFKQA